MEEVEITPLVITCPYYFKDRGCGYCKGKKENFGALREGTRELESHSVTIGCSVEQMSCLQYFLFMNQGFRRSGTFLYKPDLLRTCCRMFTIRTNLSMMKVSKLHRKTINRFIRAISDLPEQQTPENKKGKYDVFALVAAEKQSSRFHTRYEPSKFSEEKFELYKKYQVAVHNDKPSSVTKKSFKRFLCDTPFTWDEVNGSPSDWKQLNTWVQRWLQGSTDTCHRVGPTHECYYLDDKLIAISVMDIFPHGISSVYFIWDPDYAHLSLGTLSGIREILMCHALGLDHYYLGYYIEDCPKMKYKLQFGGELLDVCRGLYFPLLSLLTYLQGGKLFVMGIQGESASSEPFLPDNSLSVSPLQSDFRNSHLIDVSSDIYANDSVYTVATSLYAQLLKHYNFSRPSGLHELPFVVPGLVSLPQIKAYFDMHLISNDTIFHYFDQNSAELASFKFASLLQEQRGTCIDAIRVLGLSKVRTAILIM